MHALKSTPLVFWGLMLCEFCQAQSPHLGIDRNAGVVRITVQGETNRDYTLQAGSLASTNGLDSPMSFPVIWRST